jgi:hypothetical protein
MKLGMNSIPLNDIQPLNASICGHQQYQDAKVLLREILGNRINWISVRSNESGTKVVSTTKTGL